MPIQEIIEAIKTYNKIIIHRHVRPDPDALGSQGGLMEMIKESFPEKMVSIVGEEEPSLSFLVTMDSVKDDAYADALVIICDTANTARIDDKRYRLGAKLIKIDHHPEVDKYGDIQYVNPKASSTSEMIYQFYLQAKDSGFEMNTRAARLLYAGIIGDTGRFLFPSSTEQTFQVAAELVAYSFDRTLLHDKLYETKLNLARLKGYILQNFTVSAAGVSSIKLTQDILTEYGVLQNETSQLVGVLGDIEGIRAWVIFMEEADLIRVRLRSKGPVINEIAAKYNGGGHPLASGATIYKWGDAKSVVADLEKACLNYK